MKTISHFYMMTRKKEEFIFIVRKSNNVDKYKEASKNHHKFLCSELNAVK